LLFTEKYRFEKVATEFNEENTTVSKIRIENAIYERIQCAIQKKCVKYKRVIFNYWIDGQAPRYDGQIIY
jgi:hypothetical protein